MFVDVQHNTHFNYLSAMHTTLKKNKYTVQDRIFKIYWYLYTNNICDGVGEAGEVNNLLHGRKNEDDFKFG